MSFTMKIQLNRNKKTSAATVESCATPLELSESREGNCPEEGFGAAELLFVDADADELLWDDDGVDSDSRLCEDVVLWDDEPVDDPALLWDDDEVL